MFLRRSNLSGKIRSIPLSYKALTVLIFGPLLLAFAANTQFYPIPVWSLFSEGVSGKGRTYFILRGELRDGSIVDIPAINLTGGLAGRNHTMVFYVMSSASLNISSPHPGNVKLVAQNHTGPDSIPRSIRINDLLSAWGKIYNDGCTDGNGQRLRAIRLDGYYWSGKGYCDYAQPGPQYRVEL